MLLVDPTGIHIHHEQEIGGRDTFQTGLGKSLMQACFSPDGSKYVRGSTWDGTRIFNFDRCNFEQTKYSYSRDFQRIRII